MKTAAVLLSTIVLALGGRGSVSAAPDGDLAKKLTETWVAAADWLVGQQDASGAWKQGPPDKAVPSAAYTGLMITALGNAPASVKGKYKASVDKGLEFLLSKANADGSLGEGPTGGFLK